MSNDAGLVTSSTLWKLTLQPKVDEQEVDRERLRRAFLSFRSRVKHVVAEIASELPGLTVHDITHLDALWSVAGEIIGDEYPLNEAEAFVLGSAFLLHDAAHAICAFEGGKAELLSSVEWTDFVATSLSGVDPKAGSSEERLALFHVLRHLHAQQAEKLPWVAWSDKSGQSCFLLEDAELRDYFGNAIGLVAASHHWDPAVVAARLRSRKLNSAAFLSASRWSVDVLKLAMILRTADAAHVDAMRAPWFLFALKNPSGTSRIHWDFQSKLGKLERLPGGELKISSGPVFGEGDRSSWWLALDVARMIDAELRSARKIMAEEGRPLFAAKSVVGVESADQFSLELPVSGWEPVDVRPKISDVPHLIKQLGGSALYGDNPEVALRELLQNSIDACNASRAFHPEVPVGIVVELNSDDQETWHLSVRDSGIGMSKYVLTEILLDFGRSLWSGEIARELPGLASTGFQAGGQFGIGFFSVFMLGERVSVLTRRFERSSADQNEQWKLQFEDGLQGRPALVSPKSSEKLRQQGTTVVVQLRDGILEPLLEVGQYSADDVLLEKLERLIGRLVPCAPVDVTITVNKSAKKVIVGDDWRSISNADLLLRIGVGGAKNLYPLYDNDGVVVGRLMPEPLWSSRRAFGVVNGVVGMEVAGVTGVVAIVGNNTNLSRTEASIFGLKSSWVQWASNVLSESKGLSLRQVLAIHPLIPDEDLPVWTYKEKEVNIAALEQAVQCEKQVFLHLGSIDHESDDSVDGFSFDIAFEPVGELLINPDSYFQLGTKGAARAHFPWILGVSRLDYRERVAQAIARAWGAVVRSEEDVIVGTVDDESIIRRVTVFRRPS